MVDAQVLNENLQDIHGHHFVLDFVRYDDDVGGWIKRSTVALPCPHAIRSDRH